MHAGVLTCAGDDSLQDVATIMAKHRVHAVAITDGASQRPVGVVSDLDIVAAAASGEATTGLQAAASEPLAVSATESLERAARLMSEHGVSHLVVVDGAGGFPIGVLSTLDIATVYADS